MRQLIKKIWKQLGFSTQLAHMLNFELRLFVVRQFIHFFKRTKKVKKIKKDVKIIFGCGETYFPGWLHVDCISGKNVDICLDLRKPIPFPDGIASMIFSEHFVEHLEYEEGRNFLSECFRLLKPSGIIRLVVPDLEKFINAYILNDQAFIHKACPWARDPLHALNIIFRQGLSHKYCYDFKSLKDILVKAGFQKVEKKAFGESEFRDLLLDRHDPIRITESLYVEGRKGDE